VETTPRRLTAMTARSIFVRHRGRIHHVRKVRAAKQHPRRHSRLLRLPAELREQIYSYVAAEAESIDLRTLDQPPALALANRQLLREVTQAYFTYNDIFVKTVVQKPRVHFRNSAGPTNRGSVGSRSWLRHANAIIRLKKIALHVHHTGQGSEHPSAIITIEWSAEPDTCSHTVVANMRTCHHPNDPEHGGEPFEGTARAWDVWGFRSTQEYEKPRLWRAEKRLYRVIADKVVRRGFEGFTPDDIFTMAEAIDLGVLG